MNLLALDLGKRIGIAYTVGDKIQSCSIDVTSEYHALIMLENYIVLTNPAAVFYEDAPFQPGWAGPFWHNQRGILVALCQKHGRAYDGVNAMTLKKHTTGSGKATKLQVIAAVNARITGGYSVTDHNEADALALLLYVMDNNIVEVGE